MRVGIDNVANGVWRFLGAVPRVPVSCYSQLGTRRAARRAISLIEVLISMFVLLFGLMGVAAIFPVGNHYVVEGEKFDLASSIAQNAFEELRARGVLRPEVWHYSDPNRNLAASTATGDYPLTGEFDTLVMQSATINDGVVNFAKGTFNIQGPLGPGHAFVIDPLGTANGANPILPNLDIFPYHTDADGNVDVRNPPEWRNDRGPNSLGLSGDRWPVRRLSVLDANGLMSTTVAETIFRLRDDLTVEQPDESDRPSIQRWDAADINPLTGNANNTPDILSDDSLLRRQYKGDYSWLATIVPTSDESRRGLQPANADYGEISCDVSIVVFRKRDETPSADSERLISAELLPGGELVIYALDPDVNVAKQVVDAAIDGIRPGNWISLMGVNRATGTFVMKWYRIVSLDDETTSIYVVSALSQQPGRRLMLIGPDWPTQAAELVTDSDGNVAIPALRAGLLPGVVSVVTKPLKMENTSLWKLQ